MKSTIKIDDKITGTLVRPKQGDSEIFPIAILLHGFASDKDEVGGLYVKLAAQLSKLNIASLRIDFLGCGSREKSDSSIATIDEQVSDAIASYKYVYNLPWVNKKRIGVCGFSMGAAVALISSTSPRVNYSFMTLISPAGDLTNDFRSFLGETAVNKIKKLSELESERIELPWRRAVLNRRFFAEFRKHDLYHCARLYNSPLYIYAPTNDFSYKHALYYESDCGSTDITATYIEGADHIFNMIDQPHHADVLCEKASLWAASIV